jgi:hypothetical protein
MPQNLLLKPLTQEGGLRQFENSKTVKILLNLFL